MKGGLLNCNIFKEIKVNYFFSSNYRKPKFLLCSKLYEEQLQVCKKSPKSDIKFEASSFLHVFLEEQSYLFIQESSLTFFYLYLTAVLHWMSVCVFNSCPSSVLLSPTPYVF